MSINPRHRRFEAFMRHPFSLVLSLLFGLYTSLFGFSAQAAGEQFYFVAMVAPIDSLSKAGTGDDAVYLRWDEVEGRLPADLEQIILLRDGVEIYRTAAQKTPDIAEIKALYAGDTQKRRMIEMINRLKQLGLSESPARSIKQSNFASEIATKIQTDPFWTVLASRQDFNIARARGRGFLDTSANAGVHEYELMGESTAQGRVRLGRVEVDTNTPDIIAASPNFTQVQEFARCDAPEYGKSHGVVALNWDYAGASSTDRYINALTTAGFDIYRAVDPGPVDFSLDIRQLAANQPYDAEGVPILPGLLKLNELPVMIGGSAQRETTNEGWNPEFSKYLETYPEIKAAGLKPGDKRAYYLVARDISGNYGYTAAYEVEVPDLVAPPAPWDVRQITNLSAPAAQAFKLRFSAVNVANYASDNRYGRRWCNLDRARLDKQLTFVGAGQQCESDLQREVDLGVQSYLIYRFSGIEEAKSFSDSDGDGYADLDERIINPDNPLLSEPGTACVVNGPNLGPDNYLVATLSAADSFVMRNGRATVDFADVTPANNRGQVFWYRFASRGLDGRVGNLSEPIRGHFPDRKRSEIVQNGEGEGLIGVLECAYDIGFDKVPPGSNIYAEDQTGDASWVRVSCLDGAIQQRGQDGILTLPIQQQSDATGASLLSPAICRQFVEECSVVGNGRSLSVDFLDASGNVLAERAQYLFPAVSCPLAERPVLTRDVPAQPVAGFPSQCKDPQLRPILSGEVLDVSSVFIDLSSAAPSSCVEVYRDIGGKPYRLAQFCPPFPVNPQLSLDGLEGANICLSYAFSNENNELSVPYRVPCFTLAPDASPDMPQIFQLRFNGNELFVNFRPPEQPVAGTLLQWYEKGSNRGRSTAFKAHPGQTQADGSLELRLEIEAAPASGQDWQQEWCVRGRSVGINPGTGAKNGNLSSWSTESCGVRLPPGESLPQYLPWPRIVAPNEADSLLSTYLSNDGLAVVQVSESLELNGLNCALSNVPNCQADGKNACLPGAEQTVVCDVAICSELRTKVKGGLDFVVYRQTATDNPDTSSAIPSDFIQVSPLIDQINCSEFPASDRYWTTIIDPYLKLLDFSSQGLDDVRVSFVDRVPHIGFNWYRYQLVYMDKQGEILNYRTTQWIQAN